jgi:hypothetical protein
VTCLFRSGVCSVSSHELPRQGQLVAPRDDGLCPLLCTISLCHSEQYLLRSSLEVPVSAESSEAACLCQRTSASLRTCIALSEHLYHDAPYFDPVMGRGLDHSTHKRTRRSTASFLVTQASNGMRLMYVLIAPMPSA